VSKPAIIAVPGGAQPVVLPGARSEHSNCFGCSVKNMTGLALSMHQVEQDGLVCTFRLPERFESYPGVIHGGIVSTVLDEVMGNVIAVLDRKLCFTITLRVKYLSPLHTDEPYRCVARLVRRPDTDDDIYKVDGEIHPADRDELLAIASATYKWITMSQASVEMSVKPAAVGQYVSYLKPTE
jgi:acyl-coenzyme A thioesterase PaaI-like protein